MGAVSAVPMGNLSGSHFTAAERQAYESQRGKICDCWCKCTTKLRPKRTKEPPTRCALCLDRCPKNPPSVTKPLGYELLEKAALAAADAALQKRTNKKQSK